MKIIVEGIDIPETLRKYWSFHNDIAIPLEMKARRVFGDHERPVTKIYDADSIECGNFAEVMISVLRENTGRANDRKDVDDFIKICSHYIGKNGSQINHKVAQGLFDRFSDLIR